jgi:hypothetical protein
MSLTWKRAGLIAAALGFVLLQDAGAAEKLQTLQATKTLKSKALKAVPGGIDLAIKSILPPPDPIPGLPNQGYCYKWPVGGAANRVIFAVRNQGPEASPASVARVTFAGAGAVDAQIIALAPGQERDVEVGIPAGCYPPGFSGACTFTITADAPGAVTEAIESNNQVQSLCILPAG